MRRHIHHSLEERALQTSCSSCNSKAAAQLSLCSVLALGGVSTNNEKETLQAGNEFRYVVDQELQFLRGNAKVNYTSGTIQELENNDTLVQAQLADNYIGHIPFADVETVYLREIAAATSLLGSHPYPTGLLEVLAQLYQAFGEFKRFAETSSKLVDMMEEQYDRTSLNILMAQVQLGVAHRESGNWIASEEILEYVVRTMRETRGTEFPSTLHSMTELGCTYRKQERWEDAEKLDEEIVNLQLRTLGQSHPDTLTSISNLAVTYYGQNKLLLAKKLQKHALDLTTAIMGPGNTETLHAMANLAVTYASLGKSRKAKNLSKEVLLRRSKDLGHEHPDTISAMSNLAQIYVDMEKLGKAKKLGKAAKSASSKILGENHPTTLVIMGNLAEIYQGLHKWKRAEALQSKVCIRNCFD